VYKELAKIAGLISRFGITDRRMEALRENFETAPAAENEIRRINQSVEKLKLIKAEIQKGTQYYDETQKQL
jgi:hypothetical protein